VHASRSISHGMEGIYANELDYDHLLIDIYVINSYAVRKSPVPLDPGQ